MNFINNDFISFQDMMKFCLILTISSIFFIKIHNNSLIYKQIYI